MRLIRRKRMTAKDSVTTKTKLPKVRTSQSSTPSDHGLDIAALDIGYVVRIRRWNQVQVEPPRTMGN
ncbi:UNVERIFIED_CONTAM: hypothetical protein PYX00_006537 [Menopon gallinae]|uniref:Uncharacterized protein n=1 Tax=Menopon gallinae TaxID=328185 RepID=A0AAW2HVN1_9NEOP